MIAFSAVIWVADGHQACRQCCHRLYFWLTVAVEACCIQVMTTLIVIEGMLVGFLLG